MYRRGSIFTIMLDFLLISVLIFGFIVISKESAQLGTTQKKIGSSQYDLLFTLQQDTLAREKTEAIFSLYGQTALLNLARVGGAECSTFEGFAVFNETCTAHAQPLFDKNLSELTSPLLKKDSSIVVNGLHSSLSAVRLPPYMFILDQGVLYASAQGDAIISQGYSILKNPLPMPEIATTYGPTVVKLNLFSDVPSTVVLGLIAQESRGDPYAVSGTSCKGLTQFCTDAAFEYGLCDTKNCKGRDDRFDPDMSIIATTKLLHHNLEAFKEYDDKMKFSLAAYNGGEGFVNYVLDQAKQKGNSNPTWEELKTYITAE